MSTDQTCSIEHCDDNPVCQRGEVVGVRMADLAQQAVQAKPFEQAADATPTPTLQPRAQLDGRQNIVETPPVLGVS